MGFRVLASDPLDPSAVAAMREAGLDVDEKTDLTPEQLEVEIAAYDAIVIRSATKVRANIIDAGKQLKLVVRAGVGLDNVDLAYAKAKDVTRKRLFLETLEEVFSSSNKVIIEGGQGGTGVVPYLPLPEIKKRSGGSQ